MMRNLVHPSIYYLTYSRNRVLKDKVVGVNDAIEIFAGNGEVLNITRMNR